MKGCLGIIVRGLGRGSSGISGIGNTRLDCLDGWRHGGVWDGLDDGGYDCHDLHGLYTFPFPLFHPFSF